MTSEAKKLTAGQIVSREANRIYMEQFAEQIQTGIHIRLEGTYPEVRLRVSREEMTFSWRIDVTVVGMDEDTGETKRLGIGTRISDEHAEWASGHENTWTTLMDTVSQRIRLEMKHSLDQSNLVPARRVVQSNISKFRSLTEETKAMRAELESLNRASNRFTEAMTKTIQEEAMLNAIACIEETTALNSIQETVKRLGSHAQDE